MIVFGSGFFGLVLEYEEEHSFGHVREPEDLLHQDELGNREKALLPPVGP